MFDCSVYVTLHNKTKETLYKDSALTYAKDGQWLRVPLTIGAGRSAKFQLQDASFSGSDGNFDFIVRDSENKERAQMKTHQACPWPSGNNDVSYTPPRPLALYDVSFDANVDGGRWTHNWVEAGGHPVNVVYTIDYQAARYRFTLETITAVSAHPVRNSRDDLVVDKHVLWSSQAPDKYKDGKNGSFAPNIFAHDFKKHVSESGHLDVTVRPLDIELAGAEAILYGTIGDKRVLQTDYFFLKALAPITVQASVISPATSSKPFAWNADVMWHMELRLSARSVTAVGLYTTPLELYWIATTTHRAFQNGVPVGFLRDVLKKAPPTSDAVAESVDQVAIRTSDWNADMTRRTFEDFNKIYDTAGGASACGMGIWGGVFWESYYRAPDESGVIGTLYRHINCMDQAAMLELECSLLGGERSTSWLAQQPYGFINTTHLVGVKNANGYLINVNNPFFGTEQQYAWVDRNYDQRTAFGCHVYVGNSRPFNRTEDAIYDACGGPHVGNEVAAQYVTNSIDTGTNLYNIRHTHPGDVNNIQMGDGVTGINGTHYVHAPAGARARPMPLLDQLFAASPSSDASVITHVDWAHVPAWLPSVLGDNWVVRFASVTATTDCAHAFFHVADTATDAVLRITVTVHAVAGEDGTLDKARSIAAAHDRLASIVDGTDRDPEALWVLGALDEFGDRSLQYGPDVAAGRVLVLAASTVVDIAGLGSTAALEGHARSLLGHVVRRDAPPLRMPVLRGGRLIVSGAVRVLADPHTVSRTSVRVEGVNASFTIYFEVEGRVAAAGATCATSAVLFDKYVVEEGHVGGGEGGNSGEEGHIGGAGEGNDNKHSVHFTFLTRELGTHEVRVHVADAKTMVTATHLVEVEVV